MGQSKRRCTVVGAARRFSFHEDESRYKASVNTGQPGSTGSAGPSARHRRDARPPVPRRKSTKAWPLAFTPWPIPSVLGTACCPKCDERARPTPTRRTDGDPGGSIPDCANPLFQAFLQAGQQAGYALTEDVNSYRQEGFYRMERSTFGGVRSSAARRYLHPARERGNIDLKIKVRVSRLLFDGKRANGVEFFENGRKRKARGGEIILSAGAIQLAADPEALRRRSARGIAGARNPRDRRHPGRR